MGNQRNPVNVGPETETTRRALILYKQVELAELGLRRYSTGPKAPEEGWLGFQIFGVDAWM